MTEEGATPSTSPTIKDPLGREAHQEVGANEGGRPRKG